MTITLWYVLDAIVAAMMIVMFPAVPLKSYGFSSDAVIDAARDAQPQIFWDIHVISLLLMMILTPVLEPLQKYFGIFMNNMMIGALLIVYACFNLVAPWEEWGSEWGFYSHLVSFIALILGIV